MELPEQVVSGPRGALDADRPWSRPEAKAEQEKYARVHAQTFERCKMWSGPEHDSDVHSDWSVQQTTRSK